MSHHESVLGKLPIPRVGPCRVEVDGDDLIFVGGPGGSFALSLAHSSAERVWKHWVGYAEIARGYRSGRIGWWCAREAPRCHWCRRELGVGSTYWNRRPGSVVCSLLCGELERLQGGTL